MAGCGGLNLVPVSGTVYVDGKPVSRGSVIFKPDQSRGNTSGFEPIGVIGPDGTYANLAATSYKGVEGQNWNYAGLWQCPPLPGFPVTTYVNNLNGAYNGDGMFYLNDTHRVLTIANLADGFANLQGFRSFHPGGLQFAFADGSVHFVGETISMTVYRAMATISGGEVASLP
jgi:prepilin-type processing-associated H-X9-DG protein